MACVLSLWQVRRSTETLRVGRKDEVVEQTMAESSGYVRKQTARETSASGPPTRLQGEAETVAGQ